MTADRWRTAATVLGTALVAAALGSMLVRGRPLEAYYALWMVHNAPVALMGLWVGALVLRTRPGNTLGRLLVLSGMLWASHVAAMALADHGFVAAGHVADLNDLAFVPAELPLSTTLPRWFASWVWVPAATLFVTLLLALFPDGRYPGPKWRWIGPVALVGATLFASAFAITAWPWVSTPIRVNDPPGGTPLVDGLIVVGGGLVVTAALGTVGSLVVRWRTVTGEQRRQLRAVLVAGGAMAMVLTLLWPWQAVWVPVGLVSIVVFLVTYTVAIARYRLHDLDVVLNKALVATLLATLVMAGYVGIVVGVGTLVDWGGEQRMLSLLAVGVVAVGFEPARRRVRLVVDRTLYGRDGDAYAVLSGLATSLRRADSEEQLLDHVAERLARSTAADAAVVVVDIDGSPQTLAVHGTPEGVPLLVAPLEHHGRSLGQLRLHGRGPGVLAPDAESLTRDIAATLGLLVANLRLRRELQVQVTELQRSRQRLVRVHDEARRELERDLHDGAQARLVALRLRLGLAAELAALPQADRAPAGGRLRAELDALAADVEEALAELRQLSHGLHPAVLQSAGLVEALRRAVEGLPLPVRVEGPTERRFGHTVEAAVYFACLEAVQNAVKHGARERVEIRVSADERELYFEVCDDGPGWDPAAVPGGRGLTNLGDRIGAVDGTFEVLAAPGRGTVVRGVVPVGGGVADTAPLAGELTGRVSGDGPGARTTTPGLPATAVGQGDVRQGPPADATA